jgi:hypothetical protein
VLSNAELISHSTHSIIKKRMKSLFKIVEKLVEGIQKPLCWVSLYPRLLFGTE